jgi:hypothetical protein
MSERERWVIYPLLFLALGAALRDKLFDRTTTRSIVCQELTVVDEQPVGNQPVRVLARIGRAQSATSGGPNGSLFVNGELEVVDEAVRGQRVLTVPIVKIGRDSRVRVGTSSGFLVLNGQLQANRINADQYTFRGLPFVPSLQAIIPWSPTDLMQALRSQVPMPPRQPSAAEATPQQSSDAASDPQTKSPTNSPLADPPENR